MNGGKSGAPGVEWKNYLGTQKFVPKLTFTPASEADVAAVVARAAAEGERVHASGAGHSSTRIVATDGWLLDMQGLTGVTQLRAASLAAASDAKTYVRVLAGTRIDQLNTALAALGLAMPNLGSAAYQAIAGAIATGTHGSGVSCGALCDLVRSVDLVDGAGKRVRVEPTAGFTSDAPADVTVQRDDDWFHSVVVGVGVTGIVTSLVLEVTSAFDLEETRTLSTWAKLRDDDALDVEITGTDHYEIWLNPYAAKDRDNTALVTKRTKKAPDASARNPRVDPWPLKQGFFRKLAAWALDELPLAVEPALDFALRDQATKPGAPHRDASFRIFNLGAINDMPAYAAEWFFPMKHWKAAVDALLREAARLRARPHVLGACPFGVRFIRASGHFLAMTEGAAGEVFCSVELPMYTTEHHPDTLQYAYERVAERHHGRPHWGQLHRARPSLLAQRYPKLARYRDVQKAIDPNERFANRRSYAERLTKTRVPRAVVGDVDFYEETSPRRRVLPLGHYPGMRIYVDRRRFDVETSAARFVEGFRRVLEQPGFLVAHQFEVLRQEGLVGKEFSLGERFQGRFALDEMLVGDATLRPTWWMRLLAALHVRPLLESLEDQALSNFGEVTRLELGAEGRDSVIEYKYLTGTPFAGNSLFTVTPTGPSSCRYVEQITFQPTDPIKEATFLAIGLRMHNKVVFGQVEAAADLAGARYTPLDPDDTGKPNGG